MSKGKPPAGLLRNVGTKDVPLVETWWNELPLQVRQWLQQSYGTTRPPEEEFLPLERAGFFVDTEEFSDFGDESGDYYEYLVSHKDTLLPEIYRFHVCRAHPAAQAVLEQGVLKQDFICPFGLENVQCPLLNILSKAPGKSWVLCETGV